MGNYISTGTTSDTEIQEKKSESSVIDVLSGKESIKFDLSLDTSTIIYLMMGILAVGTYFIIMKKYINK